MPNQTTEIKKGNWSIGYAGDSDYGTHGVYIFHKGKLVCHQSWKKKPTKKELEETLDKWIEANSVFAIKTTDNEDTIYVEKICFENSWYKSFRNTNIRFTDSIHYALKIKSKELAEQLKSVCEKAIPGGFEIITLDPGYVDKPKD